jgi:hypothetical protein
MDRYLQGVVQESRDRKSRSVPDLESYIALRRDTSGCEACFALTEYGHNLDIPDDVMEHPLVHGMTVAANDWVSWTNVCSMCLSREQTLIPLQDIYSFNKEQAAGDHHNIVCVVMINKGLDVQSAIDYVGDLCEQTIHQFKENHRNLPSWGPIIDKEVGIYISGLKAWMIGNLYWFVFRVIDLSTLKSCYC